MNENLSDSIQEIFKNAENSFNDKMKKYSDSVKESLALTDLNILEKSLVAPSLHHGFINCLFSEKSFLKKINKEIEKVQTAYFKKYGSSGKPNFKLKIEMESIDEIKKLNILKENQKELIYYLEEICKIMSSFNYNIKNSVDLLKLSQ